MSSINSKEHYQRHNSSKAIGQNVLLSTLLLRQRSSNCMSRNNTSINSANVSISSRNSSENVNNSNNHGSNNHHTHHVLANHVLPEIRSSLAENDAECDKDKKESKNKRKSKNTKVNSPNSNSTITQSESSPNSSITSSTRVKNMSSNSTNSDSGVPHRSELKPIESARNKTLIAVTPTISTPSTTPTLITISPSPPLRQGENYKTSNGSNSSNSCSHTPMTKLTRANVKMDLHQTEQVQQKKNEEEEQQQEKYKEQHKEKEQQKKEEQEKEEKLLSSEKEKIIREENVPTHLTSQNAKNTITNNYNNFSKFKRNSNLATSPKAILSTGTNTKLISPTKNVTLNSARDKANCDEKNKTESMTNVKIHTPRNRTSESSNNNNDNFPQQGQNGNKAENTERGHVSNTRQLKARESNRVAFIVESNDVGTINEGSNHNNKEHEQRLRPIRRTSNDPNINAEFGVHLSRRAIYIIQKINNVMRKCTSFRGPKASESEEHLFEALSALHNSTLGTLYINHPEVTFASRSCVLLMEPFHRDEMINGYRLVGYFTPGTVGRSYFAVKEETTISSLKTLSSTSSSMVVVSPNLPETQLLRRESNRANVDKDGIYTTNTNNDNNNNNNNSSTKNKNREKEGESTAKSTVANTILSPQLINGTKANINKNINNLNNNNCTMNSPMSTITTAPFDSSKSESEMRNVETPLSVRMNKKTDNNTSFANNTSSSNSGSNNNNNNNSNNNTNPSNACVDGVSLTSTTASSSNVDVDASFIFKNVSFVLRPHLLEPVMAEQRVLVNINYDNIAKIWDVLCDDVHENLLIVTAMHRNGNIARYAGKLNDEPEKLRRILREVGIGLRIIHSHKIYHHNLKLENVLEIGENRYCIADAGFARLFASQCPEALVFNGELASLPPEVFDENGHYAIVHPGEDEYEEYVHYQKCYGSTFANFNNYNSSSSGSSNNTTSNFNSNSNINNTMTTNSPTSTNNTTIHGFCSSSSSSSVIPFNYQHVAMVDM